MAFLFAASLGIAAFGGNILPQEPRFVIVERGRGLIRVLKTLYTVYGSGQNFRGQYPSFPFLTLLPATLLAPQTRTDPAHAALHDVR